MQICLIGSGSTYVDTESYICVLHMCAENYLEPFLCSTIKLDYKWLDGEIAYWFFFKLFLKIS